MKRGPAGDRSTGLELVWPGKYDSAGQRVAVPRRNPKLVTDFTVGGEEHGAQLDCFDGESPAPLVAPDRLIVADNLLAMDALAAESCQVDLVVADPPFSTGGRFDVVTRVGEGATRTEIRTPAYSDRWQGGAAGLIAMLAPRLRLAHTLLAPHGSLYIHVDPTVGHAVKLLLDEIFGPGCFQREIVWRIGWVSGFKTKARNWIRNHDLIFFYVKDPKRFTFNKLYVPYPPGYTRRDGSPPTGKGVPLDDVWNGNDVEHGLRGPESMDSIQIKSFSQEKTGYATQKNESLLRRIIAASSNEGDLVLDPFCGSGTTLAVARVLGRRFIGVDTSRSAAQISLRRIVGAPGPALVLQSLRRAEREALAAAGHDWANFADAQPAPEADSSPEWVGRRDGVGVVVDQAAVASESNLQRAAQLAGGPAEVLAWSWRLAIDPAIDPGTGQTLETGVPKVFGGAAIAIAIERDVVGPNPQPRQGLSPLACPRVRLRRLSEDSLRVELCGLTEGWPDALPDAAAQIAASGLDLIDGWALDTEGAAALPAVFSFASFRHHHRRTLVPHVDVAWTVGDPLSLRVRTWDVLQRTADLVLEVAGGTCASAPLRVVGAELQVGDVADLATA